MSHSQNSISKNRPDEIFKILIATDIHLGYEERASKKSDRHDSFTTFEEILQLAVEKNVDFVLLGGDLFHDSKPSQSVVLECINLLKKYCLGDRPINFSFLSNPADILSNPNQTLNFENENLNIGLPIFTIHGNHDNPSFNYTGTLDILVASGLVNYFAKVSDLTKITVTPMVLEKGGTYIAIYGISFIGEQRLSRLFSHDLVTFLRPNISEKCFNILVIHQNRAQHSKHGHVTENKLPEFFDLIFWGHEHECKIIPQEVDVATGGCYHITQPGSSVATSLSEGEAKTKHVGLLKIRKSHFTVEPLKLQTVRPFIYDSISLTSIVQKEFCEPTPDGLLEYVDDYIEHTMLKYVEEQLLTGHPKQPTLPLLRLKLFYSEEVQKFDAMKITRKYCDRVANPNEIILFAKEKSGATSKTRLDGIDDDAAAALAECFTHNQEEKDWSFAVQNGIEKYFEMKNYKLKILSILGMNEALDRCVKANDDEALGSIVQHQITKTVQFFEGRKIPLSTESYQEEMTKFQQIRAKKNAIEERIEVQHMLDDEERRPRLKDDNVVDILDSDPEPSPAPTTRGRGRGSRGPRSRARGRATSSGRGRGSAKAPLDINTSISGAGSRASSNSRERLTQTVSQFKMAQVKKTALQTSQFENIQFSDSD